jgi:Domain of unknown function (DUF2019)
MTSNPRESYIEFARQFGIAEREGDAPATNKAYEQLISALRELRKESDKGERFLLELLENDDLSVVTWSALYLLPLREADATAALERVAKSGVPRIGFSAEMTLKEWRAGRLKIE